MDNRDLNKEFNSFKKNLFQKIAIFVLAIFGIFVMVIWVVQFKNTMQAPFNYANQTSDQNSDSSSACADGDCGNDENLRIKDTDKDGLTDWDELNIYNTSPYLSDSDSDGISDGEEVRNSTDPNCPSGENCFASGNDFYEEDIEEDISDNNTVDNVIEKKDNLQDVGGIDLESIISGKSNASDLRKALLGAGMDVEILNQLSDEDLIESYQKVLNN